MNGKFSLIYDILIFMEAIVTETKVIQALLRSNYSNFFFMEPLKYDMGMDGSCQIFVICVMLNVSINTLRSNSPPTGTNHSDS